MKTVIKMMGILLPAVLACAACLFWGCQNEPVADFSEETRIEDVVGGLAHSDSQAEAEAAIRNLLNKAEMGTAFPGSRYEAYAFSDEDIADLAESHLLYSNGELQSSLGDAFHAVMRVADRMSVPEMGFDTATDMLEGQTAHALAEPEEPENAILVAIATEDGRIPAAVPSYSQETVRSPVQTTLFALWLHREFAGFSGTSANLAPADGDDDDDDDDDDDNDREKRCRIRCYIRYIRRASKCYRRYPPEDERDECLREAEEELRECLERCHDQGKSSG